MTQPAQRCVLQHPGFVALGDVLFQSSPTDGVAMVLVPLGGRYAGVPLRALQRELGIDDESADGRMLALVTEALDYVAGLQLGDLFPREVVTGEASWAPDASHVAAARRRLDDLVRSWAALAHDAPVQPALADLARAAELSGPEAASERIGMLAEELAFIEALHASLLLRVRAMASRLEQLVRHGSAASRSDELHRTRRLAATAVERIAARFAEIEAQTGEIVPALRNVDGQRSYIRSARDWLHRSRIAWEPLLQVWEATPPLAVEAIRRLVPRTYQFLAPRFMTVQEWQSAGLGRGPSTAQGKAVLTW